MKYCSVVIPFAYTPRWGQIVIASLKAFANDKDLDILVMNNTPDHDDIKAITDKSLGEDVTIHQTSKGMRWHGGALDEAIDLVEAPYMFSTETDVTFSRPDWLDWYAGFMKDEYVAMAGWYWSLGENIDEGRKYINSSATLYNTRILKQLLQECRNNTDTIFSYGLSHEKRYKHNLTVEMVEAKHLGPFSESRGFQHPFPPHKMEPDKWWHEPGSWLYNRCTHQWECVRVPGALVKNLDGVGPPHKYNFYGMSESDAYVLHYWGGTVSHNFEKHLVSVQWEADSLEWWLKREYRIWEEVVPEHIRKESISKGLVKTFDAEFAYAKSRVHLILAGQKIRAYHGSATPYIDGTQPEPDTPDDGLNATIIGWHHDKGLCIAQFDEMPPGKPYHEQYEEGGKWYAHLHPMWCVKRTD